MPAAKEELSEADSKLVEDLRSENKRLRMEIANVSHAARLSSVLRHMLLTLSTLCFCLKAHAINPFNPVFLKYSSISAF